MTKPAGARRTTQLERLYDATVADVWELWTTKDGIESWWGPDGFRVEVRKLDLKPGGELLYAMIAVDGPQKEFMKQHGMPLVTETKIVFREIVPQKRLHYTNLVDFVPDVAAYDVDTLVELVPVGKQVKLVLTLDAMHDVEWTNRAIAGWEMELSKLTRALAKR